jgi:pyruvate/2-oxoglutarate dehydrogenase complex dihydrolipoamide dehydrogenase (E3) component
MAEAFTARGLTVTLVEQAPAVMPTVDLELGQLLGQELGRHGVQVVNGVTVKAIHREHDGPDGGRRTRLHRHKRMSCWWWSGCGPTPA